VEIQNVKENDFFDRFLYYHLISMVEQVKGYKEYGFDRTVYTIVVLTSVPHNKTVNFSVAVSDMSPLTELGEKVSVYPHRLIFLTPRLVNENTPVAIRDWLELIKDSLDEEIDGNDYSRPLFQEMIQAMEATTISPDALSEIKDEKAWEKVQQNARSEGLAEGEAKGKVETARKMLADGLDFSMVEKYTGLSPDELQRISE
jgi:predicted transposase/invertase (TIGR01784 family)